MDNTMHIHIVILKCYFSKFLESDDFEEGFGCFEYWKRK